MDKQSTLCKFFNHCTGELMLLLDSSLWLGTMEAEKQTTHDKSAEGMVPCKCVC
jgi:hypothetical protein